MAAARVGLGAPGTGARDASGTLSAECEGRTNEKPSAASLPLPAGRGRATGADEETTSTPTERA